jgi:predicted RNA-binding protein with PIN domain
MPYIIDGHNLIGKLSSIDLGDPDDEEQLIQLLDTFMTKNKKRGVVFFDRGALGGERKIRRGRLEIHFVRPPLSADDAIYKYVEKIKPEATNFIIVSSDRQLQKAAKGSGVRWMKSEEFASLILHRKDQSIMLDKPDPHISPQEVDNWERLFKTDKEDK